MCWVPLLSVSYCRCDFRSLALCLSFLLCKPRTVMARASQDRGEV